MNDSRYQTGVKSAESRSYVGLTGIGNEPSESRDGDIDMVA